MQDYEYKCVPAPMALEVNSEKDSYIAVCRFADLINRDAINGWEFYSMETISISTKPGCLSSSSGGTTNLNMLVFRRLKQDKTIDVDNNLN